MKRKTIDDYAEDVPGEFDKFVKQYNRDLKKGSKPKKKKKK